MPQFPSPNPLSCAWCLPRARSAPHQPRHHLGSLLVQQRWALRDRLLLQRPCLQHRLRLLAAARHLPQHLSHQRRLLPLRLAELHPQIQVWGAGWGRAGQGRAPRWGSQPPAVPAAARTFPCCRGVASWGFAGDSVAQLHRAGGQGRWVVGTKLQAQPLTPCPSQLTGIQCPGDQHAPEDR